MISTMRKQYIKPDMEVLALRTQQLLSGSNMTLELGEGTLDASESLAPEFLMYPELNDNPSF